MWLEGSRVVRGASTFIAGTNRVTNTVPKSSKNRSQGQKKIWSMVKILTRSMVHVRIRDNHTSKKDLVNGRNLVNFGPNLFGSQMAPIFVILFADSSFLPTSPSHTSQAQLRSPHFRQMPPKETTKTKNWGQRDLLAKLIQAGLVDIKDLSRDNIDKVHKEHFRHRSVKNFC